jgi:hypothetical protein
MPRCCMRNKFGGGEGRPVIAGGYVLIREPRRIMFQFGSKFTIFFSVLGSASEGEGGRGWGEGIG